MGPPPRLAIRQQLAPPLPDSCGRVKAMRRSNAPIVRTSLAFREHPVTANFFRSSFEFREGCCEWSSVVVVPVEIPELPSPCPCRASDEREIVVGVDDFCDAFEVRDGRAAKCNEDGERTVSRWERHGGRERDVSTILGTLTVRRSSTRDPTTTDGFWGIVPYSVRWRNCRISSRRHSHEAFVVIFWPL